MLVKFTKDLSRTVSENTTCERLFTVASKKPLRPDTILGYPAESPLGIRGWPDTINFIYYFVKYVYFILKRASESPRHTKYIDSSVLTNVC